METILIPTILSGGAGSRLWPLSRKLHPKPFIQLPDGISLLQKAFLHGSCLPHVQHILTVTNSELFFKTRDEFQAVNSKNIPVSYILEPFGKNTAPAVGFAAFCAQKYHPDAVLLVLPADHLIEKTEAFQEAVANALPLAKEGALVMFGMKAESPETGYGYIQVEGRQVIRFVEKPNLEKAESFVASGDYLWNSGMFCFRADSFLKELKEHGPEIYETAQRTFYLSKETQHERDKKIILDAVAFKDIPDNSIDYAVIEKSRCTAVVPCDIGWNDIGSWNAFAGLTPPESQNNRIQGEVLLQDTENCFIQSPYRLTTLLGVQNLLVIDTPDALLVADKSSAQDVKHLYNTLKAQNHDAHKLHQTVFRPWGTYTILEEGAGFKIKRIEVNPNASISLQMHHYRSEHWVVVEGEAMVTNGEEINILKANQSTYIPAGNKHRLENRTHQPVVIIEVQTGEYLGENDIVRFEDVYGREILA